MKRIFQILLVLFLVCPTVAMAQSNAESRAAAALKREGDDHLTRKLFVQALDDYDRSYAIEPNPALHYNRGRALEFLTRYPEALDAFARFSAEASPELKARVPDLDAHVAELKSKVATVSLTVNIAGARVLLGGHEVGKTPLTDAIRVNAGNTTLEVFAEGYVDYRMDVTLRGGTTTPLGVRLALRDVTAYLIVKSPVVSARVSIDGHAVGIVPAEAKLKPGPHPIRVEQDGYVTADAQIVLHAGERREISIDLNKSKPITARWWFWTGIGVVVVGAVAGVTAYALTTERHAGSGNFSPGQVSF